MNHTMDVFDNLDVGGGDGFRIVRADGHDRVALYFEAWEGGEQRALPGVSPEDAAVLLHAFPRGAEDGTNEHSPLHGRTRRLQHVLEAICRYFNTGGDRADLISSFRTLFEATANNQLSFPGYYLADSWLTSECVYQHLFVAEAGLGSCVLWEEKHPEGGCGFIDRTTLEEIAKQEEQYGMGERTDEPTAPPFDPLRAIAGPEHSGEAN